MSRPVGRHRARRNTGIGALRRPAVAATAAISTVSVAAAAYSTAATANATVTGTAQTQLLLPTSTALRAADSGVAADGQAQLAAAQQAVSARKAADARSRAAAAARARAATKLQSAAKSSAAAAQRAADEKAAAKKAAAARTAAKKAAAKRATTSSTSRDSTRPPAASFGGSPQAYASSMLSSYGWGQGQMSCLVSLWNRESGWRSSATNPSSGAYGIPQSLPGSKMASAGADWQTNPATQIRWGLSYIRSTYGSPCGAWGHSQATGWY